MIYQAKEFRLNGGRVCTLRSAAVSDAPELLDFLRAVNEETYFLLRYPEEVTYTQEEEETIIQEWKEHPNKLLLLAVIDGCIAGNCGITPAAGLLKTQHRGSFGISVKKAFWTLGIGRLLMSEVLAFAKNCGMEQVELGVFSDNTRALGLYRQFGFTEWGRIPRAYKLKDGTYRDEIHMGLPLIS
ncbi:MAG: GNAT family N-acetyltransferase [Treponema sp.]